MRYFKLASVVALLAMVALFARAPAALAQPGVDGPITIEDDCMQEVAGFGLNCTANDVRVAGVASDANGDPIINITDPCDFPGDTVTFTATFEVLLTAQERHDIAIYFALDGDPNGDGALTGTPSSQIPNPCSISTLAYNPDPPWLDLDGTSDGGFCENDSNIFCESDRDCRSVGGACTFVQDICGDIDADHNPLFPEITITAKCVDFDNDGFLNLPNCTSWRQPGANELCLSPLDAFPGAPSKCRCDIGFNVPIPVPPARLLVTKTANPTSVDEPGAPVTYTVSVTNIGVDPNNPVTLNSLMDDIYGNITQVAGAITSTTCSVPQTIPSDDGHPGGIDTYTCTFTANVSGEAEEVETDTVTASGVDTRGNSISGEDSADVTIDDVLPAITVGKTANPITVDEPGGAVTFTVEVTNNSVSSDPVTINSLTDNIHLDLNGQGDCSVPQTLAGDGGKYICSFTAYVTGNGGYVETDTVTASGVDDEGNPVSDSDSATVTVLDIPSSITLTKSADPTSVDEPGGDVTYTFIVNNTSTVDTVYITSLMDSIYGDLNGQGTCGVPSGEPPTGGIEIGPGGSYTCSATFPVTGNAFGEVTNTATAQGVDDDGEPVQASDSATVDINNVPPAATLIKTATMVLVTYEVTVTNDSEAEALTLTELGDDVYNDITTAGHDGITETNCAVPQVLEPNDGVPAGNDTYTCTFKAMTSDSPTNDTVTGSLTDDDGSTPVTPSDSATVSFE